MRLWLAWQPNDHARLATQYLDAVAIGVNDRSRMITERAHSTAATT